MTGVPETIGLLYDGLGHYALATIEEKDSCILFRRLDLPATDAQAMQNEKVKVLVEVLKLQVEAWSNALELNIIAIQHRSQASIILNEARAALAALKEGAGL